MIASIGRSGVLRAFAALAVVGSIGGLTALGQQQPKGRGTAAPAPTGNVAEPKAVMKAVPVNPNDPVALVNGESITRAQLSDECVARKGTEILDTLIARKLIDQALRSQKLQVTAPEIEEEIEKVAMGMAGLHKNAWLLELEKNRNVSPLQYRRDIIYPSLALRKLAIPRVEVTATDLKAAYEAKYGEKLVCRMIMVPTQADAQVILKKVKDNPSGFQKEAELRSRDEATRAMGGMLGRPLSRHEQPAKLSDAAFEQLVDGDRKDLDPTHKPKDGDISGLIQIAEYSWIILKRESVLPAQQVDFNDPNVRTDLANIMKEVKIREEMARLLEQLTDRATIENKLTGQMHWPELPEKEVELHAGSLKSMAADPKLKMQTVPLPPPPRDTTVGRAKAGTPLGVSDEDRPFSKTAKKPATNDGSNP